MDEDKVTIEEVSINDANTPDVPDTSAANDNADATPDMDVTPQSNPEIEAMRAQIAELNDKYLRVAAELENTRRRATIDAESRARTRAMGVAEQILPLVDAIYAALSHNPDDAGIQSMARAMESALTQIGIVKIDSVGQVLNPTFHNAIQVVDAPDANGKKPAPNTIVSEMQAGYMFGDAVLRTAMVVVAK